jgi:hypothetical protein
LVIDLAEVGRLVAEDGQLLILPADREAPENPEPRSAPVVADRPAYQITLPVSADVIVLAAHLPDRPVHTSDLFKVLDLEVGDDLRYSNGLASLWGTNKTIVNVEQDMQFSDELVAELVECPEPLCAYPYQVYPTAKGKFIYCGTTDAPEPGDKDPRWLKGPDDTRSVWHSIGFCKITPQARVKPIDRMFWKWLEHAVNRVVCREAGLTWHVHWPEIRHYHNYLETPDHLW